MVKKYLKYVVISMLCISVYVETSEAKSNGMQDKLLTAIETSNIGLIKRLLRRMDSITEAEKKALAVAAHDAVDERETSVHLFKSPWDLGKLAGGLSLSLFGGFAAILGTSLLMEGVKNEGEKPILAILATGGAAAALLGTYLGIKGLRCSAALQRCKEAETIEELVENIAAQGKGNSPTN